MLYALQGTGNGHVARAREIIPILKKHFEVDVWISGNQSEVALPVKPKYRVNGIVMFYNKKGGISFWKSLFKNNYAKALRDIWQAPVQDYDLVLNDFEFITARACRLRGVRCIQISHQASFKWRDSPRPKYRNFIGEIILKYYSNCKETLGFHFYQYNASIYPPVIRKEIRDAKPLNNGHITVYLPAFHHDMLIDYFSNFHKIHWHVFSKFAMQDIVYHNITIKPIENTSFIESFISCSGILCGAGFETPAEAMYMGKKLAVLPIKNQYEQLCNAAALKMEGVTVLNDLSINSYEHIHAWLKSPQPSANPFPVFIEKLLLNIISK